MIDPVVCCANAAVLRPRIKASPTRRWVLARVIRALVKRRVFIKPPKVLVNYKIVLEIRPGTRVRFLSFAGLTANRAVGKGGGHPCKAILLLLRPFTSAFAPQRDTIQRIFRGCLDAPRKRPHARLQELS